MERRAANDDGGAEVSRRPLVLMASAMRVVGAAALTACGAVGEEPTVDDGGTPTESGTADAGTETSGDGDGDGDGDGEEPRGRLSLSPRRRRTSTLTRESSR